MKNSKRAAAVSIMVGGLAVAGAGAASVSDAVAHGKAVGSPGVGSGKQIQVPVDVPVNACGNSVNVVGLLNPTFGNFCINV
ncbi:chaplin [Streptomyces zagrosensis]|uniref:Chaplin domain-containing protein n=1 Tax=Streptomyces zagrosensis TaxID=1042984 RepID=A0A7W9Q5Y8_9ACTN|nr:chaplin [Streptomyces zagrosensis]MBB5933733.1 hypothetical protein [Streptomyces zagrosensis]